MSILDTVKRGISANSPTILIGAGVVGVGVTIFMAAKASLKAEEIWYGKEHTIETEEGVVTDVYYNNGHEYDDQLKDCVSKAEYVKHIVTDFLPVWGPVALVAAGSIACFVAANRIQVQRKEVLAFGMAVTERAYRTYREKTVETVGAKKHMEIVDKAVVEEMGRKGTQLQRPIQAADGDYRFYDAWSGRYFFSNIDAVRRAETAIHKRLHDDMQVTINDYYEELGLDGTRSGNYFGWDANELFIDVNYSPIFDPDGHPCTALSYLVTALEHDWSTF